MRQWTPYLCIVWLTTMVAWPSMVMARGGGGGHGFSGFHASSGGWTSSSSSNGYYRGGGYHPYYHSFWADLSITQILEFILAVAMACLCIGILAYLLENQLCARGLMRISYDDFQEKNCNDVILGIDNLILNDPDFDP